MTTLRRLSDGEAADLLPGRLLLYRGATMPDGSEILRDVELVGAVNDRLVVVRGARDEVEFYTKPDLLFVVEPSVDAEPAPIAASAR